MKKFLTSLFLCAGFISAPAQSQVTENWAYYYDQIVNTHQTESEISLINSGLDRVEMRAISRLGELDEKFGVRKDVAKEILSWNVSEKDTEHYLKLAKNFQMILFFDPRELREEVLPGIDVLITSSTFCLLEDKKIPNNKLKETSKGKIENLAKIEGLLFNSEERQANYAIFLSYKMQVNDPDYLGSLLYQSAEMCYDRKLEKKDLERIKAVFSALSV